VWGFFNNALHLLRPYCEIHISHKAGGAYDRWDIEDLAFRTSLVLVEKVAFQQEDYPGYNQKRGDGARSDEAFDLGTCFTFMFQIRDLNWKKLNGDMASSVGIMPPATKRGPSHMFPPDEAWPRQRLPPPVNTVHMPTSLEPDGVAQSRQHPDSALNFDGTVRDPYFQLPGNTRPMIGTPGPLVIGFHNLGGAICAPLGRIPCPDILALQEKTWYEHEPTADAPRRDHCYLARENQWGLQSGYDTQGHVMPVESHSALLEHQPKDWEFIQKNDWLRRMVVLYGGMS
jgi:25S rRNA (uracil2634-N3)-methyltransferase